MAEGELGAIFEGLAKDAGETAGKITESVAKLSEQTADLEERNVARLLDTDAKSAEDITAAGRRGADEGPGAAGDVPGRSVPGPAGTMELRRPNARHDLDSIGRKAPAKAENTVVMPGTDTSADLRDIQAGRAHWNPDTQRYELPNGRVYGVKGNGTLFPVSGPGFEELSRGEYQALQQYIAADGDLAQARAAMDRNPFLTEADKQQALEIFQHHKSYRG